VNDKKCVLRSHISYQEVREKALEDIQKQCQIMKESGTNQEIIESRYAEMINELGDKFRMFFKIKVVDAMYDEEKAYSGNRDSIVTIMDTNLEMYDSLQVGDRVVFYKLFMDTYGKNNIDNSEYLQQKQLTMSYKPRKSQYDNLRQYDLQSENDKKVGKMRIEKSITFHKLFERLIQVYEKSKSLPEEQRVNMIKHNAKLQEISLVGLILKVSAGQTEFTRNMSCIKKVYLLLPNHHLMILNVSSIL